MVEATVKSRRLGYLKILARFILADNLMIRGFQRRYEDFALNFRDDCLLLNHSSGIICSKNGRSAKPYVKLAMSLELLSRSNRRYVVDSAFHDFALQVEVGKGGNIFDLDTDDFHFLFNRLWRFDNQMIKQILLTIFRSEPHNTSAGVRDTFRQQLLLTPRDRNLDNLIKNLHTKHYLERLFYPRLHWLIDLKVLKMNANNSEIALTEFGITVCQSLGLYSY